MSGIQAMIFDAYGTLFDVYGVCQRCDDFFPGQGEALSRLWRTLQLEYSWLRALMEQYADFWQVTDEALQMSCRLLGLELSTVNRQALMQAYLTLPVYADVLPALHQLQHLPLAILSNGAPQMLAAVVQQAGLADSLTHVFSVDARRTYKPKPAVYEMAAQGLGLPRQSIAFVSSNSWDVAGAGSYGFRTFWLNRAGNPPEILGPAPYATIRSLDEFVRLVTQPGVGFEGRAP